MFSPTLLFSYFFFCIKSGNEANELWVQELEGMFTELLISNLINKKNLTRASLLKTKQISQALPLAFKHVPAPTRYSRDNVKCFT